ncbi:MAG: hypothetical protein AAF502_17205 [Bacteroidota bacterium]
MKKLNLIIILFVGTLFGAVIAQKVNLLQQPGNQSPDKNVYTTLSDPCSENVLYLAADQKGKGEITQIEFEEIIQKHQEYKRQNCLESVAQPVDPCDEINLSNGGRIGKSHKLCGPGNVSQPLENEVTPVGGNPKLSKDYQWQKQVKGGGWTIIAGANSKSYSPGVLRETTTYRRLARKGDCDFIPSNEVKVKVGNTAVAKISASKLEVKIGEKVDLSSPKAAGFLARHKYDWSTNDGSPHTSKSREFSVSWNTGGLKEIILSVRRKDCISTDTIIIKVIGHKTTPQPIERKEKPEVPEKPEIEKQKEVEKDSVIAIATPSPSPDSSSKVEVPTPKRHVKMEGGPCDTCCTKFSVFADTAVESQLSIKKQQNTRQNSECVRIGSPQILMSHPIENSEMQGKDTTLMFDLVPAFLTGEYRDNMYVPFVYEKLRYFEWREGEIKCNYAQMQIPPPGFSCSNHPVDPKPGICGKLNGVIANLKNFPGDCSFFVLFPSRSSNKVFGITKDTIKVVPNLSSSLFHFPNKDLKFPQGLSEDDHANMIGHLLYRLAVFLGYDSEAKILQQPKGSSLFFTVAGKVNNRGAYLISFGFDRAGNYREYTPVKMVDGSKLSQALTKSLVSNRTQISRLMEMVYGWQNTGAQKYIEAALPGTSAMAPLKALGSPTNKDKYPPHLLSSLRRGRPVKLLVNNGSNYQVMLPDGSIQDTWLGRQLTGHQNNWLYYLAIADNKLQVLNDSPSQNSFVFFFRNSTEALWSWVTTGKVPKEKKLLDGMQSFLLADQKVENYIRNLKANPMPSERAFWLDQASSNSKISPLDYFKAQARADEVFMFGKGDVKKMYRLGEGLNPTHSISIYGVGVTWKIWRELKPKYQSWRKAFVNDLAYSRGSSLEAWYAKSRFGTSRKSQYTTKVGVYLPKRAFRNLSLAAVRKNISDDGIIYRRDSSPSQANLFKSWLTEDWKALNLWRANPLGYLERVQMGI